MREVRRAPARAAVPARSGPVRARPALPALRLKTAHDVRLERARAEQQARRAREAAELAALQSRPGVSAVPSGDASSLVTTKVTAKAVTGQMSLTREPK